MVHVFNLYFSTPEYYDPLKSHDDPYNTQVRVMLTPYIIQ